MVTQIVSKANETNLSSVLYDIQPDCYGFITAVETVEYEVLLFNSSLVYTCIN